jgi:uncharacterized protein involved in outer membrane biogenesis
MRKIIKRFFISLAVLLGLLLLAAVLIPVLFKDKLMALARTELNEKLNANTDFKDVSISLFRHFPHLSVGLDELSITGKETFKNDTLIAAKRIDVTVDLLKAISGTYDIINIALVYPRIHALVNEDGTANWNITKPDTAQQTATASKPISLKLRHYEIDNAYILYDDAQGKMRLEIVNLTHSGSGDFGSDIFTLSTHTDADELTFADGNVTYLYQVKTLVDLDLNIDNKNSKYSFNTEKIQLNGLGLSTKGFVQLPDTNNTVMDVQFSAPSNNFKDVLSLVPGIYQSDFKNIKTTGKFTLSGFLKGTYNKKQMPAYGLSLTIQDGSFQYPALPQKVSDIQIKLAVNNPDGITDHTVVNLEKGHIALGAQPFDFALLLKTPISDQWIDATAKGRIDLSQIQSFIKLADGTKLSGVISADVAVKGSIAAAEKKQFDKLSAAGTIDIANLAYASKDYPDGVAITHLNLKFNPANVTMTDLRGAYMQTNFTGDGSINNLLGYYFHNEALSGAFHFSADKINVNKWIGTPAQTTAAAPTPTTTAPFLVPANLNITLHAEVTTLQYDNLTLTGVQGGLAIANEVVNLQNVSGKGLDGMLKIDGFYSTLKDKKNPDIQFDYDVQNIDVQQAFTTFNTVRKLMPVARYISGKVTSSLSMTGKLGPDMSPAMNTLTGKGTLLLTNGTLSNFPVTDQLADKLNMSQLKSINLKDVKENFSFTNGRVTIDPYKTKIGDVDAEIAGSHGFDQTIDYGINLSVPRSTLGAAGNNMINGLVSQAAAKGIPVTVGDKVNLTVKISGTMTSPKIETNLKNVAGSAVDNIQQQAQQKIDSVKSVVKDSVKVLKTQAVDAAKNELKKQLMGGKDTSSDQSLNNLKKTGDDLKKGLNGLFK